MLDIKFIAENPDHIKDVIKRRNMEEKVDVDQLLELYARYKELLTTVEDHRALKNQLSDNISKVTSEEDRAKLITEATNVKQELASKETELTVLREQVEIMQRLVPNLIADDVPEGKDENENIVARTWGEPPKFDFEPKDHIQLGEIHDLIDIPTSAKVSGSRLNYLKNEAVLIQFALIQFVFDTLTNKEIIKELADKVGNPNAKVFSPVLPPILLKGDVAKKMDRFDPIEDRYYLENDDLMLVGSAEHTMGPMFMDETISEEDLPIRYIGYSTALRREAGSYGKDTGGILRRHQFDKLEMEVFSLPENGQKEQDLIVAIQEYLLQQLELPHQVIAICTGDMGKPDYRQIDMNTWMPSYNAYRETHTSDYMTDYQSRRLNTKYKKADGETGYVHMNDATAFAIGRALIAILENNQQEDGSIEIPKVLQKYMGGRAIIGKHR